MKKINKLMIALLAISLGMSMQIGHAVTNEDVQRNIYPLIVENKPECEEALGKIVLEIGNCQPKEIVDILSTLKSIKNLANQAQPLNDNTKNIIIRVLPQIIGAVEIKARNLIESAKNLIENANQTIEENNSILTKLNSF